MQKKGARGGAVAQTPRMYRRGIAGSCRGTTADQRARQGVETRRGDVGSAPGQQQAKEEAFPTVASASEAEQRSGAAANGGGDGGVPGGSVRRAEGGSGNSG